MFCILEILCLEVNKSVIFQIRFYTILILAEKEERNLPVAFIKTQDIVKKAAELLHVGCPGMDPLGRGYQHYCC